MEKRLRLRRNEIQQATLDRILELAGRSQTINPIYWDGLRRAVDAALDYGLAAVEVAEERSPPVPAALLSQARLAARYDISFDTVLRRYIAGQTLFNHFLMQEVSRGDIRSDLLPHLLGDQAIRFDRLVDAIADEYKRESESRLHTPDARLSDHVHRLLAGELIDISELAYDLNAWHIGVIGRGFKATQTVRDLAKRYDRRVLLIKCNQGMIWAWLGGHREVSSADVEHLATSSVPADVSLAIGEQAYGPDGWRLTHHQAKAALPIMLRMKKLPDTLMSRFKPRCFRMTYSSLR